MLEVRRLLWLVRLQGSLLFLSSFAAKRVKVRWRGCCSVVPEIAILAAVGRLHACRCFAC